MNTETVRRDLLLPREPNGRRQGIALSVLVHIGLVIAIAFGLNWRSHTPKASEAELWAAVPQAAAPREVEPVVAPTPPAPPPPAPAPVVKPVPKVVEPPAPLPDAQIAIEKARKEELRKEQERKEQERLAKEAAEREALKKKLAIEKAEKAEKTAQAEKAEKAAKAERERIAQQEAEKQKKLEQALEAKQAKQLEAARADQLKRIQGMAGASGDAGAKGSALHSAGPSAGYAGRIKARVRPNIVFADQVAGNPTAEVEVRAAPDGAIIGRRLVKSSGIPSWDEAVLRAIDKTAVLPRDVDGRVPGTLLLVFQPGE
ncbi:MAG: cell envelope integrity protein TolA [Burkholderiales bacterium]